MFNLSPDQIEAIKIMAAYGLGALSVITLIIFAVVLIVINDSAKTVGGDIDYTHKEEIGADLDYIDQALAIANS